MHCSIMSDGRLVFGCMMITLCATHVLDMCAIAWCPMENWCMVAGCGPAPKIREVARSSGKVHVCRHVYRHVRADTSADMCTDMCIDLCTDLCISICIDIAATCANTGTSAHMDMRIDMRRGIAVGMQTDMCAGMCIDTSVSQVRCSSPSTQTFVPTRV